MIKYTVALALSLFIASCMTIPTPVPLPKPVPSEGAGGSGANRSYGWNNKGYTFDPKIALDPSSDNDTEEIKENAKKRFKQYKEEHVRDILKYEKQMKPKQVYNAIRKAKDESDIYERHGRDVAKELHNTYVGNCLRYDNATYKGKKKD